MAKLYFYYSSMNAGKSTQLLQADFNYRQRGMTTLLLTAAIDTRSGSGRIVSRIGLGMPARTFAGDTDLRAMVEAAGPLACVLVDEAQFLTHAQVLELAAVADDLDVPVLTYGLRTDFLGTPFEGSLWLLAIADVLSEIKAVCTCGRKATMNLRVDADGRAVTRGGQTEIGGNDRYVALCRRHFTAALKGAGS
ncbi:MAG: thymidine kinase [Janthinobacterium lividum]